MRFTLYNILYKRILVIWIFSAFVILLGILFGNKSPGLVLFGLGVAWLILNAAAIFLCMWVKLKVHNAIIIRVTLSTLSVCLSIIEERCFIGSPIIIKLN
jgi:hypothetical protein